MKVRQKLPLLLLLVGASIPAQNPGSRSAIRPTAVPGPASGLLQLLREETKPEQSMADVRTIWETDRWFTFPKFEETAKNVAGMMRRAGLDDVTISSVVNQFVFDPADNNR